MGSFRLNPMFGMVFGVRMIAESLHEHDVDLTLARMV
jgi:hypothetical protein